MRVAHCVRAVFPQHGYGGLERAASSLTGALLVRGVDVALFTRALPEGQPFHPPLGAKGRFTVHPVRYGRLPLRPNGIPARLTNYRAFTQEMGRRVEAMCHKDMLDVVYAQGLSAWGVRHVSRWGVPLVANPQGLEEFKVRDPLKRLAYAPFRAWVRAGCRAADRVIATDRSMLGEVMRILDMPESRVAVIPNGVDVGEMSRLVDPATQAALAIRWPHLVSEDVTLKGISVGRLEANKGFEHLVRAFGQAKAELRESWSWVLVGEGSMKPQLEALVAEYGLQSRFFLAGSLNDTELHSLYAMSNLFVHPTLFEGSSLVTLEAMAHALPVVASAVGGIPDKVVEGETGFLMPPANVGHLAGAITWMVAHPAERAAMGRRGAQKAAREFSWNSIAAQTEALMRSLVLEYRVCERVNR